MTKILIYLKLFTASSSAKFGSQENNKLKSNCPSKLSLFSFLNTNLNIFLRISYKIVADVVVYPLV